MHPYDSRLVSFLLFPILFSAALNSETGTKVAIKKIARAFEDHLDAKKILREIKLMKHLTHENVSHIIS